MGNKNAQAHKTQQPKKAIRTPAKKKMLALELKPDYKQKNFVERQIIRESALLYWMTILKYALPILGVVFGALMIAFGYRMEGWFEITVNGISKKSTVIILGLSALILVFCVTMAGILHVVVKQKARKNVSARAGEKIMFSTDNRDMTYSYHAEGTSSGKKTRVHIPLTKGQVISYEPVTRRMVFRLIDKAAKQDEDAPVPYNEIQCDNFVIYDYFAPSIYESLKVRHITVIEGESND